MDPLPLPDAFARFPRTPLLWNHGSHIERLDRITNLSDGAVGVWIKRDDCNSGLAFGGNKLRALEYILPDIISKGCDVVVAEGGTQSNTVRQVAAAAAKKGLERNGSRMVRLCLIVDRLGSNKLTYENGQSRLVQRPGSVNWKEPSSKAYHTLGNVQITKLITSNYTEGLVQDVLAELKGAGRKPYHIPAGTSGIPLGGVGYARLAFEIIQQEKDHGTFFDTIVLPSAGGTTSGAMLSGFRFASLENPSCPYSTRPRKIISVFVGSDAWSLEAPLQTSARATMDLLRPNFEAEPQSSAPLHDVEMEFSYNAGGYGNVDKKTIRAMKLAGSLEGLVLDPVYTGKAFACMLGRIENKSIAPGSNVLFLHTGGAPVLSAYAELNFD